MPKKSEEWQFSEVGALKMTDDSTWNKSGCLDDRQTVVCSAPRPYLTLLELLSDVMEAVSLFFGFFKLDLKGPLDALPIKWKYCFHPTITENIANFQSDFISNEPKTKGLSQKNQRKMDKSLANSS